MNTVHTFLDSRDIKMALLIKAEHTGSGIEFLTEDKDYQQVAYMGHPAGHVIVPHVHNKIPRIVDYTCETLIICKGVLAVELYEDQNPIHSFEMKPGDILTLFSGGHGFQVIEDVEMVEIKQGPFMGPDDKTRF